MPKRTKDQSEQPASLVGFKLDAEAFAVLDARAKALGTSSHLLARQYVLLALTEDESRRELTQTLQALLAQLIELRKDCSLATQTLLVSAGKATVEQAEKWISENFLAD